MKRVGNGVISLRGMLELMSCGFILYFAFFNVTISDDQMLAAIGETLEKEGR